MSQKVYRLGQLDFVLQSTGKTERDLYMSQALFSQPNRRALNVFSISHGYVDLDVYRSKFAGFTIDQIVGQIIEICRDADIEPPSWIVYSGRGFYAKWAWTHALPRAAAGRAVAVNRALVRIFADLGADPAAVDVSRILRVVGSMNTKSGEKVRIVWQRDRDGEVARYNFDAFADEVLPYSLEQVRQFREKATEVRILRHERARRSAAEMRRSSGNQRGFAAEDWSWGVLEDLRRLVDLRYPDGIIAPGMRDAFGFLGACQLARVVSADQLWPEIDAWSRLILPSGYVESELANGCSTLLNLARSADARRVVGLGIENQRTPYRYTKARLIESLQITGSEMTQMTRLIDAEEKRRRDRLAWRADHTGQSRAEYRATVTTGSAKAQKPWTAAGVSRATWYRRQGAA